MSNPAGPGPETVRPSAAAPGPIGAGAATAEAGPATDRPAPAADVRAPHRDSAPGGRPLRLGTRRSKLAMAQSGMVADQVRQLTGRPVELVEITTYGDVSKESLARIGGTGVFVSALRDALLTGGIDFAVHSLKDLPTAEPDDLVLAAIPVREDPRDALVARDGLTFAELPPGAKVGTGSPRRMAQLNAWARSHDLDIETVPIRGNVDTRIGYVTSGTLDAVVLAAAGLNRIGRLAEASELIDTSVSLPAPGQGHWPSSAPPPTRSWPHSSPNSTTRSPGPP